MDKLIQKKQRVLVIWVIFLFVMATASQQRPQISMNFAEGTYTRTPTQTSGHIYESRNLVGENLTSENSFQNENGEFSDEILHLKKGNNKQNFQKLTRKETRQLKREIKREIKKSIKAEIKKHFKDFKKANRWKTWQTILFIAFIIGIIVSIAFFWSTFGWIVALVLLCLTCAVGGCGSGSSSSSSSRSSSSGGKCRAMTCNGGKVYTTNGTYNCLRCGGTGVE